VQGKGRGITPMTLYLSIIATIISISSLVLAFKNFRRSKRLEFLQRRDQLLLKISDLNAKTSEARLISARFRIVLINKVSSPVVADTHAEELKTQIASIREVERNIDVAANHWEETIHQLRSVCSILTLNTAPTVIEHLITKVQVAEDDIKQNNEAFLASLQTFETTDPMLRVGADKIHELKIPQAELNLEESIREIYRRILGTDHN
jgi:hypothetical protein